MHTLHPGIPSAFPALDVGHRALAERCCSGGPFGCMHPSGGGRPRRRLQTRLPFSLSLNQFLFELQGLIRVSMRGGRRLILDVWRWWWWRVCVRHFSFGGVQPLYPDRYGGGHPEIARACNCVVAVGIDLLYAAHAAFAL